jgi:membrane-anchored glycerophosphoryl diester phosphodiesterase (GDPDase)
MPTATTVILYFAIIFFVASAVVRKLPRKAIDQQQLAKQIRKAAKEL